MACSTAQYFWLPPPGALERSQNVNYHLIAITKSIPKIFKPNYVCLLTNKRNKTYKKGFSSGCLGLAPGVGLGGAGRSIFSFLNMVMWHIKLKGVISRPGYTKKIR